MAPEHHTKPLVSTLANEADLEDAIDEFVVGLGERVDVLQDAESEGNLETLVKRSFELAEHSLALGYGPMADAAHVLLERCNAQRLDQLHKAIIEITEISKRIRRGHRTSA